MASSTSHGLLDTSTHQNQGLLDTSTHQNQGLLDASTHQNQGLLDTKDTSTHQNQGLLDASTHQNQGLLDTSTHQNQGLLDTSTHQNQGLLDASTHQNQGLLDASTHQNQGLLDASTHQNQGLLDASTHQNQGLLDASTHQNQGLLDVAILQHDGDGLQQVATLLQNDLQQNEPTDTLQHDVQQADTLQNDVQQADTPQNDVQQADTLQNDVQQADTLQNDVQADTLQNDVQQMATFQHHGDNDDDLLCTIEATVVTGFEESARGEAKEKFDTPDVKAARGKLTWRVPLKKVKDVLKMGSVDNCRVVIHSVPCFKFTDQHDSLARLQKMVRDIDWESGLKAWQRIYNFPHPIVTHPEGVVTADDLVDVVIITNQPAPRDKSVKKKKNKKGRGKKKDRKKNESEYNREEIVSCEPDVVIPAVCQSGPDHETMKIAENVSEFCVPDERCSKSPVNEKGDGSAQMVSDALVSQEETNLMEVDGSHLSKAGKDNKKIRLHVRTDGLSSVDPEVVVYGANLGGEHNKCNDHTECLDSVKLVEQNSEDITSHTSKPAIGDNASPTKESSADSIVSPACCKISESEFASNVIRRLTSAPESASKGDASGADSPQMLCVTPPPTPIRSIDNPFSNLQGRLNAELLPFLDSTVSLPDRSSSKPDSQQDYPTVSGGSVDSPLSATNDKTRAAVEGVSSSPHAVSSNTSGVPLLSALASSANAERNSGPIIEHSSDQPRNLGESTVDESVSEGKNHTSDVTAPVEKVRDPTRPTFRVTCNRTGDSHAFDSSSAAASFGSAVITYLNWQVDLKNFDIEVILNIDNDEVTVSLALTKMSLHYRNLVAFGPTTLRATICYNMLRLCRIKNGDFICDPMCGTSAILIEGALNWTNCYHFGGDVHEKAIEKTVLNMAAVQEQRKISNKNSLKLDVMQWDVQHLPLRDKCVDVFVSDLPFGHRIGSRCDNPLLYLGLLSQMARTARPGARACLLTEDRLSLIKAVQTLGRYWQRRLILNINIGGLSGFVFLLTRTISEVVQSSTNWRGGMGQPAAGETVSAKISETSSSLVQDVEDRNKIK